MKKYVKTRKTHHTFGKRAAAFALAAVSCCSLAAMPKSEFGGLMNNIAITADAASTEKLLFDSSKGDCRLTPNAHYSSNNGKYFLTFQGSDGNLVLYRKDGGRTMPIWSTGTNGKGANRCVMQEDGNFVIYTPSTHVWNSHTYNKKKAKLYISDNGRVYITSSASGKEVETWTSNDSLVLDTTDGARNGNRELVKGNKFYSNNKQYYFVFQHDGNLVLYHRENGGGAAKWSSKTANRGSYCVMQEDGNLVVYDAKKQALWRSGSCGKKHPRLFISDQGKVYMKSVDTKTETWSVSAEQKTENYIWPVPGFTYISSPFGSRWGSQHQGVDVGDAGIMNTPVLAAKSGTVTDVYCWCSHNYGKDKSCGCGGGYGNYVTITHDDGTKTHYAHMGTVKVALNERVSQGQKIGTVGSTGDSTGAHLHFEIYNTAGVRVNPLGLVTPE